MRGLPSLEESVANPEEVQEDVLARLIRGYARTAYGRRYGAREIASLAEFRRRFPVARYEDFVPYLEEVLGGNASALLPEPLAWLGVTSGTRGTPKVIPITISDISDRLSIMTEGMKAIGSEISPKRGACLCTCFPSEIARVEVGGREVPCGYISGIYAEIFSKLGYEVLPPIEEVNAIGDGVGRRDWAARFELVLKYLCEKEVAFAMGSAYALYQLGRYMADEHGVPPREVWNVSLMLCAGEPRISEHYARDLRKLYGTDVTIVEAYGATEGMFAMQVDDRPYLVPFYGAYVFEVKMGRKVKMLYEMREGEVGSLVVSTRVFPRYEIGDLVKCYGDGTYFRVLGRRTTGMRALVALSKALDAFASLF